MAKKITDATYSIYGIVAYKDNTWAPISVVFSLKNIFTLLGSDETLCELSANIPQLLTDIDNSLVFTCDLETRTVIDYSLSVSGLVTYDDNSTVPYLATYTPKAHTIIFPTAPIQNAIASSPVSSELALANASVGVTPPSGPPPAPALRDSGMQVVPFSVPITSTVSVSGGGAALQNAIVAAAAGTRLMIQDSLAYNQIIFTSKTNITVDVVAGQTPSITAPAGNGGTSGYCVRIGAGNSGIAVKKLLLIGSGNDGGGNQTLNGLLSGSVTDGGMATMDRLIVEDCTFSEPAGTASTGAPGLQLVGTDGSVHTNVWIHRCIFLNNSASSFAQLAAYGMCTVGGFSNIYIQNCKLQRTNAVIARASSNARGICIASAVNAFVENCLVDDIGTAGSNEAIKHHDESIFGTGAGDLVVRNCVVRNCKRGYRADGVGIVTVTQSVYYADTTGILLGNTAVRQSAGTMIFRDGYVDGAGDGTAFEVTPTEDHNDVFNVASGRVLAGTDQTINPLPANVANYNFTTTAPSLQTGGHDGGAIGVRYTPTGEAIIWATP